MDTRHIKYYLPLFVVVISFFLILMCEITDPRDDFKLIFNLEPIETIISGAFVNAATGEPINTRTITVTIEGENKNDVVDLTARPKTSFTLTDGFLSFALTEAVTPTVESPVNLVVVTAAEGFLPTSIPVHIYQKGSQTFSIHMVEINNLPEGVVAVHGTGQADGNGVVINNDLDVIAEEPITGAHASITVPVGTIIKDAFGNPLTGNLTVLVVYHNNQSEESLLSFPGGFSVTVSEDGALEETVFITGGFASIEIKDGSGRVAKTFETSGQLAKKAKEFESADVLSDSLPTTVVIQIPGGTINPETDTEVQEGDSVDVWSYDESAGVWNDERREKITGSDGNGNFTVSFTTDHLTTWNLDWKGDYCAVSRTINIVGKPLGYTLYIELVRRNGGYIRGGYVSDNTLTFLRAPRNLPVTLNAYDCSRNGDLVGSLDIDDLCSPGDLTLTVDLSNINPITTRIIHVSGYCPCDSSIELRPSGFPIWYRKAACGLSGWFYAGEVVNGEITISGLETGQTYIFGTYYEGGWYQVAVEIHEDYSVTVPGLTSDNIKNVEIQGDLISYTVELPDIICNELCENP